MTGEEIEGRATFRVLLVVFAAYAGVRNLNAQPVAGSIVTRAVPVYGPAVMDAAGNLYQAGNAVPNQFVVTAGAAQTQPGGGTCISVGGGLGPGFLPGPCADAYVAKLDAAGNTIFATYLGGPTSDGAAALTVDSAGNVYVVGTTGGSFPITPNSALATIPGSGAFAAKLSADGSRWIYSTYLPLAQVSAVVLDPQGNAYVTGKSAAGHAAVIRLNADGSAFLYNRVLAGANQEQGTAIAVDAAGNATVAGATSSADFPVSAGALQQRLLGLQNAFVTKLDSAGNIVFSTYLGGSGTDSANTVQSDAAGNIYVAGSTTSTDFPATPGSFQPALLAPMWGTVVSGFVAKITPDGSSLVYASYVMSSNGVEMLALNSQGEAYLTGVTGAGFPVTASAPQACFGGGTDVFVAHLDSHGALKEATYFGGSIDDNPLGLAVAGDGSVLLTAEASLSGGRQPTFARIRFGDPGWSAPACLSPDVLNAATLLGAMRVAPGQISTLTGVGIGPESGVAYQPGPQGQAPLALAGVQVFFDGQPAPLLYVQSRQVNVVAPFELSGRTSTTVRLVYNGAAFGPIAAPVLFANPALFRLHPGASTQAAAINQDGTINGPENPASPGSVVSLYGTGFGVTDASCTTGALNAPGPVNLAPGVTVVLNGAGPAGPRVQYAGGAPTLLCGVTQINMVVPSQTPAGLFEVVPWAELRIGNTTSGVGNFSGSTIVVK